METIKAETKALIERLPDDVTFDDVHYQLYLLEKIRRSNEAIAAGKFYTHDEVERLVETWHTR